MPLQNLEPDIESLLQPFLDQSAPIRSIVTVGSSFSNDAALLRLARNEDGFPAISARVSIGAGEHAYTVDSLARQVSALCASVPGDDLLLLPAHLLNEMLTPLAEQFSFRAVAACLPSRPDPLSGENAWKLRRSLFDRGLVCIGSALVEDSKTFCFLASDAVQSWSQRDVDPRGQITMTTLLEGGAFANQLFRYQYVKFYALRHGLTAAFPPWEGSQLFQLDDKSCAGLTLPRLDFPGFADDDRRLWERDEPPIDIDLKGYFQEIPEYLRRHRPLLRRLYQLAPEHQQALEDWRSRVTDGGQRTLVAIHIRRGDYRILQLKAVPYFRIVPEDWYLSWLRSIWPGLREPLLFIATDEPNSMLRKFREFETVSAASGAIIRTLADHHFDFEVMRRADYLAICNSSFSRMAAILAPSTQKCFLPSFQTQSFESYEPWIDPAFWARFANSWGGAPLGGKRQGQGAPVEKSQGIVDSPAEQTIWLDVSELTSYLLNHGTLTGIQRVQCEIFRNLAHLSHAPQFHFVVLRKRGRLGAIDTDALLQIIEDIRSGATPRAGIARTLRALLARAVPCTIQARDIFLTLGAFWGVRGMGLLLQQLKNSGVILGVFIHDILPMTTPEYFEAGDIRVHVKGITEALTLADFIFTTSEYNKKALAEYVAARKFDALPVHLAPLGHELSLSAETESIISPTVAGMLGKEYVLCVGTIEARKNPTYLFNIWLAMVRSGRRNIPYLVFVGRKGWLVRDFMGQLRACKDLGGRILILENVTDVELDLLYRKCILTAFPSFVEGWGLPVGESLARGKICLASSMGGVPEVGGDFADYIDPYNATDGLEKLLRYLDDPELRRSREREIAEHFEPRSWRNVADDLMRSTQALARQIPPWEGVAAITLPPDQFLPIRSDLEGISVNGRDAILSPELVCIAGWHFPEMSGARAAERETTIRFRAEAAVGSTINLVLRLTAHARPFRIRIRSDSGTESQASVTPGSEKMAVLACQVEPGNLVVAHLSEIGPAVNADHSSYWMLKGILYFDPKRLAGKTLNLLKAGHEARLAPPAPTPVQQNHRPESLSSGERLLLRYAAMDESRRAHSLDAFLEASDSYWLTDFKSDRDAPIFADLADRRLFYSCCGNRAWAPQVGPIHDSIKLIRRSDQFVSMSRFSEGAVFDRSGVWKSFGFLQGSPPEHMPWLSKEADGLWVSGESLSTAPYYDQSYLMFYNGNLHNYYHWLVEGLLGLDILCRSLGPDSNVKILFPKSMDIVTVFDHRGTLPAAGFSGHEVVEVGANLIKVREAIWIESDLVQHMPAPYLKDFQKRIAALYAGLRSPRNRRLLVARKRPTRQIQNIEQLQAFLSRYGFETVYLEGMSVVDQILLFQSAEFIISPHGAGLANLLFCEPGAKVIELMPSVEVRPFFWMISDKLDLVHGMLFCPPVAGDTFQAAIQVDIDKLDALIRMVNAHL
jgi:glycosyltransferase involved in cell wall biosynthesis